MKLTTIAGNSLALTSSAALAQARTLLNRFGRGSSVGSYVAPAVGSYMNQPTWITGPGSALRAAPLGSIPTPAHDADVRGEPVKKSPRLSRGTAA